MIVLILVFFLVISSVNAFDFKKDSLSEITGHAIKEGNFFGKILNFFKELFSKELVAEPVTEVCNDEIDNDGDGYIDCDDPDCELDENCLGDVMEFYIDDVKLISVNAPSVNLLSNGGFEEGDTNWELYNYQNYPGSSPIISEIYDKNILGNIDDYVKLGSKSYKILHDTLYTGIYNGPMSPPLELDNLYKVSAWIYIKEGARVALRVGDVHRASISDWMTPVDAPEGWYHLEDYFLPTHPSKDTPYVVIYSSENEQEEVCDNGVDDDGDGLTDCFYSGCSGVKHYEGGLEKWQCVSDGSKIELNFTDSVDNDGDGVIDGLDSDCVDNCNSLEIEDINVAGGPDFYQYSYIDEVDCVYSLSDNNVNVDDNSLKNCINLTINNNYCGQANIAGNNIAEFFNCYVGGEIGVDLDVKCSINNKCNTGMGGKIDKINVLEFSICDSGDVGEGNFSIFSLEDPDANVELEINETFDIKIKVKNYAGEKKTFKAEAQLIDIEGMSSEATENSDTVSINDISTGYFEFEMTVPEDLDEDKDYRLYYKVYESGHENDICRSGSISVNIVESECQDDDDDGYGDEDCGGSDCDDGNDDIHPGATEICNDGKDNDCDGLTDNADTSCEAGDGSCTPDWKCDSWIPESCSVGQTQTRTCSDLNNCGVQTNKPSESRACSSAYDQGGYDTDLDGLSDEWELQYFGSLAQGPNDDFDNDGYTNAQEFAMSTNPKVSDEVGSGSLTNVLLIVLIVLIVAGGIIFGYFKLKEKKKMKFKSVSYGANNKLIDYIKKSRMSGMSDNEIRIKLLEAGWKKHDVDKVL